MASEDQVVARQQELRDRQLAAQRLDDEIEAAHRAIYDVTPDEYMILDEALRMVDSYLRQKHGADVINRLMNVTQQLDVIAKYHWGLGEDDEDE